LIQLDCHGVGFLDTWLLKVLATPACAISMVMIRFAWHRRRSNVDESAKRQLAGSLFFVILVLYPQVSSSIFSALRCRKLGEHLEVLDDDYSVPCHHNIRALAWLLVVVWPLGIPLTLLALLWKQWRINRLSWEADANSNQDTLLSPYRVSTVEGAGHSANAANDTVDDYCWAQMQPKFGFCLKDYRSSCWWFEPVDMLRKLTLSGILQFIERGTALQVLVGCCLAFFSFGLQLRLRPYREAEANYLKAAAEVQLFLTFLISFVLRVLPWINGTVYEPMSAIQLGVVLVCSLVCFGLLAAGLTTNMVVRRRSYRKRLVQSFHTAVFGQELSTFTPDSGGANVTPSQSTVHGEGGRFTVGP
jgi:hypothetical protein